MGNKKSKPKSKPNSSIQPSQPPPISESADGKLYMNDPVFGKMVYSKLAGAWIPAGREDMYESSFQSYANERENNKKLLKTFEVQSKLILKFYKEEHNTFSIVTKIPLKLGTYNYILFLNDGRLALNSDEMLQIYSKDFKKVEQKIKKDSIYITQLKDNSLVNCHYNSADIYKYDKKNNKFILDYTLKCINNCKKVMEITNDRLAYLADFLDIYSKVEGKYVKTGKTMAITTIDDFIQINDNEISTISGQENEITFWDLTTRQIIAQIGKINNYGRSCLILFDKFLIVGGADRYETTNYLFVINTDSKELIKKFAFFQNIWFMTKLNEKEFITGETKGYINRYRFEENEIKLMETNRDHGEEIVSKLAYCKINKLIASFGSSNCIIYKIDD